MTSQYAITINNCFSKPIIRYETLLEAIEAVQLSWNHGDIDSIYEIEICEIKVMGIMERPTDLVFIPSYPEITDPNI